METPRDAQDTAFPALVGRGVGGFEALLYSAIAILLGVAAVLVIGGTVSGLIRHAGDSTGAVPLAVMVLDRILLALIVGELLYTLRFVLRTHELAVEPFLYIGLIAVVRRILIVTAQFEGGNIEGKDFTNLLIELGVLALLGPALASAVFLVRRSRRTPAQ